MVFWKASVYFQSGTLMIVVLQWKHFTLSEKKIWKVFKLAKQQVVAKAVGAVNAEPIIMFGLTSHRSLHYGEAPL